MKQIILMIGLVICSGVAHSAQGPEWNQLEVAYQSAEPDHHLGRVIFGDDETRYSGIKLTLSRLISDHVFVLGSFNFNQTDEPLNAGDLQFDFSGTSLGAGFRQPLSERTDFFVQGSVETIVSDLSFLNDDINRGFYGYKFSGGFRTLITDAFEVNGSLGYITLDSESARTLSFNADYHLTSKVALGVGFSQEGYADIASIGVTVAF